MSLRGRTRVPAVRVAVGVTAAGIAAAAAASSLALAGARGGAVALPEAVPDPVPPAFTVKRGTPLGPDWAVTRWSPLVRAAVAHAAPDPASAVVARLATSTPEETANIVVVLDRREGVDGRLWVRVRLPALPNGRTGWLRRSALGGYGVVHTQLAIDLARLTATLYRDGRPVFSAPVGVGKPSWPTPRGQFYIRDRVSGFGNPFYGPVAFGTSARSRVLTDWPGGGFIGIHGTNDPALIPGRVSHGCIRMRNEDILRLGRLMPIGTPVTIR